MTSVAQTAPAARAAAEASAFSVVIVSIAAPKRSPVRLCRLFSRPTPIGLVKVIGSPGRPASLRKSLSGAAVPVTAIPYFGSGSSIEWPPITGQPTEAAMSNPPWRTRVISSSGSFSRGQPTRLIATTGVPPMA